MSIIGLQPTALARCCAAAAEAACQGRGAARFDEEEIGWPLSVGETSFEAVH
jgi:hypothetical protein